MRVIAWTIAVLALVACGGTTVRSTRIDQPKKPASSRPVAKKSQLSANPAPAPKPTPVVEPKPPPPPKPKPAAEITIAAVGDIMLGSTFPRGKQLPPHDGAKILEGVTRTLRAVDIAFGNLEGPILDGGKSAKCRRMKRRKRRTCWAFRMPTRYAKYLAAAGFDMLSLSNNHAMDFGLEGRESTKSVLTKLGIAHASAPGTIAERTVKGVKVGMLSFATAWHSHDLRKIEDAVKVVTAAAKRYDVLMISFHGGAEGRNAQRVPRGTEWFLRENRGNLRKFARAVIDAGADIVLGHGPHVIRGVEVYKQRLIAYSLGNFATYGFTMAGPYGYSFILEAKLARDGRLLSGMIHPVKQSPTRGTDPDPKRRAIKSLRRLNRLDFRKTGIVIDDSGAFRAP